MISKPITAKQTRKIKQIIVRKLFGTFDYTIPFNDEGRTTILVGPNGFGKTAILKLLVDLFGKSERTLRTLPFREFGVNFLEEEEEDENGCCCDCHQRVTPHASFWVSKEQEYAQDPLTFHYRNEMGQEQIWTSISAKEDHFHHQADLGQKHILSAQAMLSFEDIIQRMQGEPNEEPTEMPDWLAEVRQSVPVHLIGTQRIFSFLDTTSLNGSGLRATVVPTVDLAVEELAELVKTHKTRENPLPDIPYRLEQLQEILNKIFLHKKLSISEEQGVVFTDSNGIILAPHDLSYGEQHAFVLFHELLFKVAPKTLVLVDEPEVSLDITWLRDLLRTFWGINGISSVDLLVVSHSSMFLPLPWGKSVVMLEEKEN